MNKIKLVLLLGVLAYGCTSEPRYSQSFVNHFIDDRFDTGCIVLPIDDSRFKIEQNSIVRARLYYDYYRDEYSDYGTFLFDLLNQTHTLFIPQVFTYDSFTRNLDVEKMAETDFSHFKDFYLDNIGANSYQVKADYWGLEKQILKACFDNGLYIFNSCLDGSYTVCATPQPLPEPN